MGEQITRVFKGRDQRAYRVSVQTSFRDKASAIEFARLIDGIKARAACEGLSLSRRFLALLRDDAAKVQHDDLHVCQEREDYICDTICQKTGAAPKSPFIEHIRYAFRKARGDA